MRKEELLGKLKAIESQVNSLNEQKRKITAELNNINKNSFYNPSQASSEISTIEKINLFRSLFKGRNDVYPRFWISRKTGKSGYSPVCKNEWVPRICQKPMIKCSECANRELLPLDGEVIRKHLIGAHIIGIYPMLQDETCYFLALDFDKGDWKDNIFAFKHTCIQECIPVAIERSRSGNGAHAWIFFEENIPAETARRMSSFCLH